MRCSNFWKHACIRPGKELVPCCNFTAYEPITLINLSDTVSFTNSLNDQKLVKLRRDSFEGKKIAGCVKCETLESVSLPSLRTVSNLKNAPPELPSEIVKVNDIESLEFFLGDQCNLRCLMCDPQSSTAIQNEFRKLNKSYQVKETMSLTDSIELFQSLPMLSEVKFVGGEPFLSKVHLEILKFLNQRKTSDIELTYYTNVTVWPAEKILDSWRSYKKIYLWLSIDGLRGLNEYIRFPSKWNVVEKNARNFFKLAEDYKNIDIRVNSTISIYNIFSVNQLELWFNDLASQFNVNSFLLLNPLSDPDFLSFSILSEKLKNLARDRLNPMSHQQLSLSAILCGPSKNDLRKKFFDYTEELDRNRQKSIRKEVPELTCWS